MLLHSWLSKISLVIFPKIGKYPTIVTAVWFLLGVNSLRSEISAVQFAQQQAEWQGIEVTALVGHWSPLTESGRRRGFFGSRSPGPSQETLGWWEGPLLHTASGAVSARSLPLIIWTLKPVVMILCKGPNSLLCVFLSLFMQVSATSLMSPLAWKGVRPMARWPRSPTGRRQGRRSG